MGLDGTTDVGASVSSDADLGAAKTAYLEALGRFSPELSAAGARLLERLPPSNWKIEWRLPGWLGDAFELPQHVTAAPTLSNLLGLSCIWLQDARIDGKTIFGAPELGATLAATLHHLWITGYARSFPRESAFWAYFEAYMAQWARATLASNRGPGVAFRSLGSDDLRALGHRGAPLKVCCAGACLLAERGGDISRLAAAIDDLLAGAVLLDHAQDWQDDLLAGRYNAFVAYASPAPQTAECFRLNEGKVLEEICLGEEARPYFDRIVRYFRSAREAGDALRCRGLSEHLLWLERQTIAYHRRLSRQARAGLRAATRQLFTAPAQALAPMTSQEGS